MEPGDNSNRTCLSSDIIESDSMDQVNGKSMSFEKSRKVTVMNSNLYQETANNDPLSTEFQKQISSKVQGILSLGPKRTALQQLSDTASPSLSCTEYAQYLGLQPTVKFKCSHCGESKFLSISSLKEHQNNCLKASCSSAADSNSYMAMPSAAGSNLRITRKVYLCSACDTYFENWSLYFHMQEVHRRHVCLYCLKMFTLANQLALHLNKMHSVSVDNYNTAEDFTSIYSNSCFLVCCTCEKGFSENENFFDHVCGEETNQEKSGCAMCGLEFTHMQNCPGFSAPFHNKTDHSETQQGLINPSQESEGHVRVQAPVTTRNTNATTTTESIPTKSARRVITQNVYLEPDGTLNASSVCKVDMKAESPVKNLSPPRPAGFRLRLGAFGNQKRTVSKKTLKKNMDTDFVVIDAKASEKQNTGSNEKDFYAVDAPQVKKTVKMVNGKEQHSSETRASQELDRSQTNKIDAADATAAQSSRSDSLSSLSAKEDDELSYKNSCGNETNNAESSKHAEQGKQTDDELAYQENGDEGTDALSPISDNLKLSPSEHATAVQNSGNRDSDAMSHDSISISTVPESDSVEVKHEAVNENDTADENNAVVEDMDTKDHAENACDDDDDDDWRIDDVPLESSAENVEEEIQLAGEDTPLTDLCFESDPCDLPIQTVLKQAVLAGCNTCVYCTHAAKIAVNGKQLAIHLLSEHRYKLEVNSEALAIDKFVELVKEKLPELEHAYFNCFTYDSHDKKTEYEFIKIFECFQCHFVTRIHKELYLHNRKMHQKNGLLCIMCKSNFYSYSELLCHLCPGVYMVANQPLFRCCFCPKDDLPSSFRFMVHIRKQHQACDVCLEYTGDQQKLSNHVWKHKLHHFCYRCGIAYRNKPDITKHLFWKHGTESVLCKRCLQKKWPYVYHFCIPPSSFVCEECNAAFTKAVALKVHKRLHNNELLYRCGVCEEGFISRKLLARHDTKVHNPVPPEEPLAEPEKPEVPLKTDTPDVKECTDTGTSVREAGLEDENPVANTVSEVAPGVKEPATPAVPKVVDVYDLPPLNLSSESEGEMETEETKKKNSQPTKELPHEEKEVTSPLPQSVWENFKDYTPPKSKVLEPLGSALPPTACDKQICIRVSPENEDYMRTDHNYFGLPVAINQHTPEVDAASTTFDHDYVDKTHKKKKKKRRASTSSNSDSSSKSNSSSSSSSCSCGTNCSCDSSSSSSSDSSSSDSSDSESSASKRRSKKRHKRSRKEESTMNGQADEEPNVEAVDSEPPALFFHESDLDTVESETDEDFYDEQPRLLMPNRNLLLLSTAADSLLAAQPKTDLSPISNGMQTMPVEGKTSKKKKKKSLSSHRHGNKLKISKHNNEFASSYSRHHTSASSQPWEINSFSHKYNAIYPDNYHTRVSFSRSANSESRMESHTGTGTRLPSKRRRVPPKRLYEGSSDEAEISNPPSPIPGFSMLTYKFPPKKKQKVLLEDAISAATAAPYTPPPPKSQVDPELNLDSVLDYVAAGYDGRTADDDDYMNRYLHYHKTRPRHKPRPTLASLMKAAATEPAESSASTSSSSSSSSEISSNESESDTGELSIMEDNRFLNRPKRHARLYCYCQCPYDEASEMIACDGKNCAIEWFHFECVGITVAPIGRWYCPDCRKRYNIAEPLPNPQYFYNPSSEYINSSTNANT